MDEVVEIEALGCGLERLPSVTEVGPVTLSYDCRAVVHAEGVPLAVELVTHEEHLVASHMIGSIQLYLVPAVELDVYAVSGSDLVNRHIAVDAPYLCDPV